MIRVRAIVLAAGLGALTTIPALPAYAATTNLNCTVQSGVIISPGISLTPSHGTVKSKNGIITCNGTYKGKTVDSGKTGTVTFAGRYGTSGAGDDCSQGNGNGKLIAILPKMGGGTIKVRGVTFQFARTGTTVTVTGTYNGGSVTGNLLFTPDQGQDCVNTKVTSAQVNGTAGIAGS